MTEDPYKYFRLEAAELRDELVRAALVLEKAPDEASLAKALRHAHTLKGAARVVRLPEIAEIAHAVEDVLGPYRTRAVALAPDDARRLLAMLDQITVHLRALDEPSRASDAEVVLDPVRGVRADLAQLQSMLDAAGEASVSLRGLSRTLSDLERVDQLAQQVVTRLGATVTDAHGRRTLALADEVRELAARCARGLHAGIQQSARELAQVTEHAEQIQHVRVDSVDVALQRTCRDAALTVGKNVRLLLTGGDVRIEADVLTSVQDALVQLVRNAVAHGIESPAERARAGKPDVGTVTVAAVRHARGVVIRCSDDGRGLDVEGLSAAARRHGISVPGGAVTPAQLVALLARGGVSTAERVTAVAGRGVGLDVVADVARRLGGQLDVETVPGKGSTFSLVLPVALSALDVLACECAGARIALPLRSVTVVRRLHPGDVLRTAQRETVMHGDATIPFVRLAHALRSDARRASPGASTAVVVAAADGSLAIEIDRVIGVGSVVVRAIPDCAGVVGFVAGASVDAEGHAQLVLDPDELGRNAGTFAAPPADVVRRVHRVLVVDDSMTTRMLEQSILEAAGYEVDTASSAEAALVAARDHDYALFLVDVEMPGMDGFSFIEQLRADPKLRETPALLISSRNDAADFDRGRAVGAQGYIVKGEFDQVALLSQIGALLRSRDA